jgi:hypothetical protein
MHMLNERLQILVTSEQRRRLEGEAKRRGTSVASLIRQAIDTQFAPVTREDRLRALGHIREMEGRFLPPDELDVLTDSERDEIAARVRDS